MRDSTVLFWVILQWLRTAVTAVTQKVTPMFCKLITAHPKSTEKEVGQWHLVKFPKPSRHIDVKFWVNWSHKVHAHMVCHNWTWQLSWDLLVMGSIGLCPEEMPRMSCSLLVLVKFAEIKIFSKKHMNLNTEASCNKTEAIGRIKQLLSCLEIGKGLQWNLSNC